MAATSSTAEDPPEFGCLLPRPRGRNAGILFPSLGVIGDINTELLCKKTKTIQQKALAQFNLYIYETLISLDQYVRRST